MNTDTDFRDIWRRTVERFPDRIAVETAEDLQISYAALHQEALAMARLLVRAGVTAGDLVGLRIPGRYRFCVALLGVWLADAVPVPLSTTAPDGYIQRLVDRVGVKVILAGGKSIVAGASRFGEGDDVGSRTGLAYVMHTSGSTGRPKPVALSHRALAAYCTAFTTATCLTLEDRFLQFAPVTFDVVFEELLPIWSVGGTAVLAPDSPQDPRRLLADIERRYVTVAELTTAYWRLLVRELLASRQAIPPQLRLLLVGGETATVGLIEESLDLGLPLAHVYGVTEAGITSTIEFFRSAGATTAISVGLPLSNSTIHVVDTAGCPVHPGATGEVWIGGDSLADEYMDDPEETARRFVFTTSEGLSASRYYRTGDLGRLMAGGELQILGRLDNEVKVNGIRVDLSEVEAALGASPLVAEVAVVAVIGVDGTCRLHAFVVPTGAADLHAMQNFLRQLLREQLPHYLVPNAVVVVDALPLTEHGKVDRQALAERHEGDDEAPKSAAHTTEQLVLAAWTAALGRPPVSLDQNFGDAGGDSLALLSVIVSLGKVGVTVTPTDCMAYPTVRSLASFLQRTGGIALAMHDPVTLLQEQQRQERRNRHLRHQRAKNRSDS